MQSSCLSAPAGPGTGVIGSMGCMDQATVLAPSGWFTINLLETCWMPKRCFCLGQVRQGFCCSSEQLDVATANFSRTNFQFVWSTDTYYCFSDVESGNAHKMVVNTRLEPIAQEYDKVHRTTYRASLQRGLIGGNPQCGLNCCLPQPRKEFWDWRNK